MEERIMDDKKHLSVTEVDSFRLTGYSVRGVEVGWSA
jgi:hypothetical protein